jgi:GNAT superfamily N-acetyltransferase
VADYRALSRYHYRDAKLGPIAGIWALRQASPYCRSEREVIGVIVYTYPAPNVAARNAATGGCFQGADNISNLRRLNGCLRCISRVVIEPRWRGLGLGTWLVRETLPLLDVPMVESMALMGRFHPFLERAGMRRFDPPENPNAVALRLGLATLGVEPEIWYDPRAVQARIDAMADSRRAMIESLMERFLGAFGRRRKTPPGVERTAFVLEKLSLRCELFSLAKAKECRMQN